MEKAKIKVGKDERVYFDGKYVSNAHWLAKKDLVQLSQKDLQGLIIAGVKFSKQGSSIATGDEIKLPELAQVVENIPKLFPAKKATIGIMGGAAWFIPFFNSDENIMVLINEKYEQLTEIPGDKLLNDTGQLCVKDQDGEVLSVILGVVDNRNTVKEDISELNKIINH